MNTTEALKSTLDIRLSHGNRWMIWNTEREIWIVYERKYSAKKTTTIIETTSETFAVQYLLSDD